MGPISGKICSSAFVWWAKDYAEYIGSMLERFFNEKELYLNTTPLLSGEDICNELNLAPSPLIGKLKNALWEAQLEGKVTTRRDAVAFLRNILS